jgi:YrhK-like protein
MADVVAAGLFVAGCIGFYWPRFFTVAVTAFLLGSILFLLAALSKILLDN